ncbi:MAG: 2OG-Fe(II) oxygenase [Wenzhouxiangellaceae bacterium]|nr:2OG-Fe(II) oxygenase [Wenzhouxiangellaceae bacterium]
MFLDPAKLAAMDGRQFRQNTPFPWANPAGMLTDEGFKTLVEQLPEVDQFRRVFGRSRKHGQQSHDRYALEWSDELPVADAWKSFVDELRGPAYHDFLARMIGHDKFSLKFHFHYTPNGCSVSPHCDAVWKLGSHIFYLNTEADWKPEWGGETQVLDDYGRFSASSAPAFEDFNEARSSESIGNRSLLFIRAGNSWHGVKPINCPEGYLRKVFIVVINRDTPWYRMRSRLKL